MTCNIQLGMLIPRQAHPQAQGRERTQNGWEGETEAINTPGQEPFSKDGAPLDTKKNTFDKVLSEKLEKPIAAAAEQVGQEMPHAVIDPLMFAQNAQAAAACEFSNAAFETGPMLLQDHVPDGMQMGTAAMIPAAAEPVLPTRIAEKAAADVIPEQAKDTGFSAVLKQRPEAADGLEPAAEQESAPSNLKLEVLAATEPKPAKTGRPEQLEPSTRQAKPPLENMPALPEKAIANTADKPAATNAPVFIAQTQPVSQKVPQIEPAAAANPSLKKTLQNKMTASTAGKDTSKTAAAFESAGGHTAAFAVQHKPELNITEAKLTGIENAQAVRPRAADAIAASRPAEQIAQSLPPGPVQAGQQIRLTLTPPELGTVRITFREQDSEIVGLVEVQKSQTRQELEESLPQLVSAMQNQGVEVRRIEVVQWNTPQQNTRENLSENYSPSAEREFMQQDNGNSSERSSRNSESGQSDGSGENTGSQFAASTPQQKEWFSDKSLNLYI
ncbi:MAG: flagellar hook-length control protein FliK [Planctomycetaceae bacterium]|nr:flagellar hook-length control protein FliK [Planctomycetaceae bacterium]